MKSSVTVSLEDKKKSSHVFFTGVITLVSPITLTITFFTFLGKRVSTGSYTEYFIEAGHWLIQESFPEVSGMILEHLK